jgi:hypothetical protein
MKKLSLLILAVALVLPLSLRASSAAVGVGQTVTFSVTADGTQPFTYQWAKAGSAIPGATASTYVISKFAVTDVGVYTVVVSNSAGSATSDTATLTQLIVAPSNVKTNTTVTGTITGQISGTIRNGQLTGIIHIDMPMSTTVVSK